MSLFSKKDWKSILVIVVSGVTLAVTGWCFAKIEDMTTHTNYSKNKIKTLDERVCKLEKGQEKNKEKINKFSIAQAVLIEKVGNVEEISKGTSKKVFDIWKVLSSPKRTETIDHSVPSNTTYCLTD